MIGGVLIAAFGWQAIFAVNLPIVVLVLVVLHRSVPPDPARSPRSAPGPARAGLRSLRNRVYVAAFATQALSVMAQYSLLLVAPIVLDARGWGSGAIGLALSALTIGMIVTGPLGGRIGDEVGRRAPVVAGLTIALVGLGLTALAGDAVASALLIASLAVFGVGHGLATPGIMTAGLESVPEEVTGTAAGLLSTSRYAGSIVSSLALAALVGDAASGAGTLFAISAVFLAASVLVAFQLPGRVVEHRPVVVRR